MTVETRAAKKKQDEQDTQLNRPISNRRRRNTEGRPIHDFMIDNPEEGTTRAKSKRQKQSKNSSQPQENTNPTLEEGAEFTVSQVGEFSFITEEEPTEGGQQTQKLQIVQGNDEETESEHSDVEIGESKFKETTSQQEEPITSHLTQIDPLKTLFDAAEEEEEEENTGSPTLATSIPLPPIVSTNIVQTPQTSEKPNPVIVNVNVNLTHTNNNNVSNFQQNNQQKQPAKPIHTIPSTNTQTTDTDIIRVFNMEIYDKAQSKSTHKENLENALLATIPQIKSENEFKLLLLAYLEFKHKKLVSLTGSFNNSKGGFYQDFLGFKTSDQLSIPRSFKKLILFKINFDESGAAELHSIYLQQDSISEPFQKFSSGLFQPSQLTSHKGEITKFITHESEQYIIYEENISGTSKADARGRVKKSATINKIIIKKYENFLQANPHIIARPEIGSTITDLENKIKQSASNKPLSEIYFELSSKLLKKIKDQLSEEQVKAHIDEAILLKEEVEKITKQAKIHNIGDELIKTASKSFINDKAMLSYLKEFIANYSFKSILSDSQNTIMDIPVKLPCKDNYIFDLEIKENYKCPHCNKNYNITQLMPAKKTKNDLQEKANKIIPPEFRKKNKEYIKSFETYISQLKRNERNDQLQKSHNLKEPIPEEYLSMIMQYEADGIKQSEKWKFIEDQETQVKDLNAKNEADRTLGENAKLKYLSLVVSVLKKPFSKETNKFPQNSSKRKNTNTEQGNNQKRTSTVVVKKETSPVVTISDSDDEETTKSKKSKNDINNNNSTVQALEPTKKIILPAPIAVFIKNLTDYSLEQKKSMLNSAQQKQQALMKIKFDELTAEQKNELKQADPTITLIQGFIDNHEKSEALEKFLSQYEIASSTEQNIPPKASSYASENTFFAANKKAAPEQQLQEQKALLEKLEQRKKRLKGMLNLFVDGILDLEEHEKNVEALKKIQDQIEEIKNKIPRTPTIENN